MSGLKIDSGNLIYNKGDIVDLMYQVSPEDAILLGDTLSVQITDVFDNIVATITASRIEDLYIAEYTIPINLEDLYNTGSADESIYDESLYYLKDKWDILGTVSEFTFNVIRSSESPISDNSIIIIQIDNLLSSDGTYTDSEEIKFTTKLSPFYCNVDDVTSVHRSALSNIDSINTALDILNESAKVDYHMRPNIIYKQDIYDNAVRNYVSLNIAKSYLNAELNIQQEIKQLDTFQINRTYGDTKRYLDVLEEDIEAFANIIYAGGEDTLFKSKTFIKGLLDPNRTNIARGTLDIYDNIPYVNVTTNNIITSIDGNLVEIRGVRSIASKGYITAS